MIFYSKQKALFADLYSKYSLAMKRLCMQYSAQQTEAEDIFHDAFVKVIIHYHECRNKENPGAWIKKIVINTALEQQRKKKVFYGFDEQVITGKEIDPGITAEVDSVAELMDKYDITSHDVFEAVNKLPHTFRITFLLYYSEGYSHKEISEQLGITEKSSRANLAKARKQIRDILTRQLKQRHPECSLLALVLVFPDEQWSLLSKTYQQVFEQQGKPFHGTNEYRYLSKKLDIRLYMKALYYALPVSVVVVGSTFLAKTNFTGKEAVQQPQTVIVEKNHPVSGTFRDVKPSTCKDSDIVRNTKQEQVSVYTPAQQVGPDAKDSLPDTVTSKKIVVVRKKIVVKK